MNGRVVREYVGGGEAGQIAALFDDLERANRLSQRAAWKAERERLDVVDALLEPFFELAEDAAKAALLTAGYHQHHRGEWRRRREPQE